MIEIPILVVEDEPDHVTNLRIHAAAIERKQRHDFHLDLKVVEDYPEALRVISEGYTACAIVDLCIPNTEAGAETDQKERLGNDIYDRIKRQNKDSVIALYSGFAGARPSEYVNLRKPDATLDKLLPDEVESGLLAFVDRIRANFNWAIEDAKLHEVLDVLPSKVSSLGTKKQWELCLRRLLPPNARSIRFARIGGGRSGAAVLTAYIDNRLPKVFKFGLFDKLQNELQNYLNFIDGYIPNCAKTGPQHLAQAGNVGILAYSCEGGEFRPITLGQAIFGGNDIERLVSFVQAHYRTNWNRWFEQERTPIPYALMDKLRYHFRVDSNCIRAVLSAPRVARALGRTTAIYGSSQASSFIQRLLRPIEARCDDYFCLDETVTHGDLNAGNLICGRDGLIVIDFGRTINKAPRMVDFVKLEASLKFDYCWSSTMNAEEQISERIAIENSPFQRTSFPDSCSKSASVSNVIVAIRECAKEQCGPAPELEYNTALYVITLKHIEYLADEVDDSPCQQARLVHAIYSAYRLAESICT